MLREVKNGALVKNNLTLVGWRWRFAQGDTRSDASWSTSKVRALLAAQAAEPVSILSDGSRTYWVFEQRFFWEDEGLSARDVLALVRDRQRRSQRKLDRAHAALAQDDGGPAMRREHVPREIRQLVFERYGGCCAECSSSFEIQFDHVIPFSMGGATTVENLQILCAPCNQIKGASLS